MKVRIFLDKLRKSIAGDYASAKWQATDWYDHLTEETEIPLLQAAADGKNKLVVPINLVFPDSADMAYFPTEEQRNADREEMATDVAKYWKVRKVSVVFNKKQMIATWKR